MNFLTKNLHFSALEEYRIFSQNSPKFTSQLNLKKPKKMLMNMTQKLGIKSIKAKLVLLILLVTTVFGATILTYTYMQNRNHLTETKLKDHSHELETLSLILQQKINDLKNDTQFLASTPPIQGIVRSESSGRHIDPKDGSPTSEWKDRLSVIFTEMLKAKTKYQQIRYIAFGNSGQEIVRVERKSNKVFRIPEKQLQKKENEFYYSELLKKSAGEIYLSEFSLNREHGKISYPVQVVVRAAVPIFDEKGAPFGFVIVNMDSTFLIQEVEILKRSGSQYLLFDAQSHVLMNSANLSQSYEAGMVSLDDLAKEEGSIADLKRLVNLKNTISQVDVLPIKGGYRLVKLLHYNSSNPTEFLGLSIKVTDQIIANSVDRSSKKAFIVSAIMLLLVVVFTLIFAQKLTQPILSLMSLAQRVSSGDDVDFSQFKSEVDDEIGNLSNLLVDLAETIFRKNKLLESQKEALDSIAIVAETDVKGSITYVNDKFLEISKFNRSELIGRDHRIINSGHHPKQFFQDLWRTISSGNIWRGEVKNKAKDGSYYWVDTSIFPVKNTAGLIQKYLAIRFDITKQKVSEARMFEKTVEAEKAMNVKSEFLANMSHEIRTPLNSIIGLADVMLSSSLSDEQRKYLHLLKDSGDALLEIVNDVLELSKIESGKLEIRSEALNIEDVVFQAAEILSIRAYEKGLEFSVDFDPNCPKFLIGDAGRVRQVLINLIGNAIKFTEDGYVAVQVNSIGQRNGKSVVELSISDSGIGIRKDNLDKIFESFTQADVEISSTFGGTGLGLNIVTKIIEKMDGKINVESEFGYGSVFKVELPFQVDSAREDDVEVRFDEKQILVVEPQKRTRVALRRSLIW